MPKRTRPPRLTPEQQSIRDRERRAQVEQQHMHCEMEIRQRGPHWGLYCQQHNKWIKWIAPQDIQLLANQGIFL